VSNKIRDNCFITDNGGVIVIVEINEDHIKYRRCETKSVKSYPIKCSIISIYRVTGYGKVISGDISILKSKCVLLPYKVDSASISYTCIPFTQSL